MRLYLGLADTGSFSQFILDLLTSPQYEPLRVGLRDIGGFLFGTGSGAFFGRPILLAALRRFAPEANFSATRSADNIMDLLMGQGTRIRELERQLDDAHEETARERETSARLKGVNETLRAIANEDELPAEGL